jgi:hypothetical protein
MDESTVQILQAITRLETKLDANMAETSLLRSRYHELGGVLHRHELQLSDRSCQTHTEKIKEMSSDIVWLKTVSWSAAGGVAVLLWVIIYGVPMMHKTHTDVSAAQTGVDK